MSSQDRRPLEVELVGGTANRGLVVRVGDTVRRPQSPTSASVHAVLRHLDDKGFDGAPRYLGEDASGREVLSYVEGVVPVHPTPGWALADDVLVSVAELLGRYHEAVEDLDPGPLPWHTTVPQAYRRGVVSHNDPNLDNVVFREGRAVALIDFDLASPGSREWDLACAARLWVPLVDPRDAPDQVADRLAERLQLFLGAAGLARGARRDTVAALPLSHAWSYDIVREGMRAGHAGYSDYWRRAEERFDRTSTWFRRNLGALAAAVSRP